ncbi:MAG: type II restriction endonuclease [Anaeroplasma sp.]|nr:type II restriction endonuclease [Anaeroplasma sp.]
MTNKDFNNWLSTFRESIADYKYYVDFNNAYNNLNEYKVELNILNSLVGSKSIEEDFRILVAKYPEVLNAIPILLAKRENEIYCQDDNGKYKYNFKKQNYSIEQYCYFMKETGLFELVSNRIVHNLVDYVLGVEVGLDSNGRKNRGGHLMENLVEKYIQDAGYIKNETYYKEIKIKKLEKITGLSLASLSNSGKTVKRFDFVIIKDGVTYAIETNFYASSGSKLNETARSYKTIALESKDINNFKFVWITDGLGWIDARNNLEETFDVLDDIYNIKELENGILEKI